MYLSHYLLQNQFLSSPSPQLQGPDCGLVFLNAYLYTHFTFQSKDASEIFIDIRLFKKLNFSFNWLIGCQFANWILIALTLLNRQSTELQVYRGSSIIWTSIIYCNPRNFKIYKIFIYSIIPQLLEFGLSKQYMYVITNYHDFDCWETLFGPSDPDNQGLPVIQPSPPAVVAWFHSLII